MQGIWLGFYKYDNQTIQKTVGFEKTNFTISITFFDGRIFKGIVTDDVATGGMVEAGTITGYIENETISFEKMMPRESLIMDDKGTRQTTDKKHPVLYYSGIFAKDKQQAAGTWKFKRRIIFMFGFIPIPFRLGKGTWQMDFSSVLEGASLQ
jgi:hypothetical protein